MRGLDNLEVLFVVSTILNVTSHKEARDPRPPPTDIEESCCVTLKVYPEKQTGTVP